MISSFRQSNETVPRLLIFILLMVIKIVTSFHNIYSNINESLSICELRGDFFYYYLNQN